MKAVIDIPEEILIQMMQKVPKTRKESMVETYGEAMTKKQVCETLNVSETTVWRMIQNKQIKTVLGGSRVDTRSLAAYLEKGDT